MNKLFRSKLFNIALNKRQFCDNRKYFEGVIARETEITTNPLVPEIKLHLITPKCRLYYSAIDENFPFKQDPFFGFFWPGGIAVTRFILDNRQLIENKRILDFGAGNGASSIAAKMRNAERVVANDIDENAVIAAQMNARLNNVQIETNSNNLINNPCTLDFDLILLGDVFYDEEFAHKLYPWLEFLLKNKKKIIVGDPGRHPLKSNILNLKLLQSYELPENSCIENHGFKFSHVWELQTINSKFH
jgi:ETFB lysine methyltransferase